MKFPIAALIIGFAVLGAGSPAIADDQSITATVTAGDGKPMIVVEKSGDDDVGPVGRVLGTGLAAILEKHVLTRDDLSEEDRAEVREAISELRGQDPKESQDTANDTGDSTREEVEREVKQAVDEIVTASVDGKGKEKHRVIINNPLGRTSDSKDGDFGIFQAIVASLAIVFTLGMPIIIVALIMFFSYRRRKLAHDTINQFLASGKEIPPEVMQNLVKGAGSPPQAPRTMLHKGTVNTGIGLGMVLGFSMIDAEFLAAIGGIFLLAGLAQLLIWKLEQGKKVEGDAAPGQ